jgi:catechol 2,3-dioxygenase-like lactoylglutathione lyase family enzyme
MEKAGLQPAKERQAMSRLFGNPTQNGIVVPDLEKAITYWTQVVGAGPFFVIEALEHIAFAIGENPAPAPAMRIALGNWGDLQIELIEPAGNSAATWHEFLRTRGGGLHHTSVWASDYDAVVDAARGRGLAVEASGTLANGVRYVYFRSPSPADPLVEVSELRPDIAAGYAFIREAARDWDGTDPIRSLG